MPAEYPTLDEICRRKTLRRQVAQAHLHQASQLHEVTLQKSRSNSRCLKGNKRDLPFFLQFSRVEKILSIFLK